jgi:hypothetical protein
MDGFRFDSQKEANRYQDLKLLQSAGHIILQQVHPPYRIYINGIFVFKYVGDFEYLEVPTGKIVCEDAKGYLTDVYKLKIKAARAYYSGKVEFREV